MSNDESIGFFRGKDEKDIIYFAWNFYCIYWRHQQHCNLKFQIHILLKRISRYVVRRAWFGAERRPY